jgi:glycosyltransferase involved in cell wall biosynthesis
MIDAGHQVEWFAASFPGAAPEELLDGIRIVRRGRQWTVHWRAFRHYRGALRGRFDVVIDQINTMPFFTPLWAQVPTLALIWQLAREVWWYESHFPMNAIGYVLEPLYLRFYRRTPVLTFSASTASDLRRLGFTAEITVVPVGIEPVELEDVPKKREPTFVYVGRLAPSKRIGEIVKAFALFRQKAGEGRLELIGNGSTAYVSELERLISHLGMTDCVELSGWLTGADKHRRMAEAHALVMASAREGWGLVVTECNACGTPAVVYNVPGLRDSVRHLETGIVVRPCPQCLADGMLQLVSDPDLYRRLEQEAKRWSRTFTYEAGASVIREKLEAASRPH